MARANSIMSADAIESFNDKCNQKDDVYAGVFLWPYTVLLQSLQMTVRKLRDTTTAPR
jgi:hypothetical protein